jgi:hypothetical protein
VALIERLCQTHAAMASTGWAARLLARHDLVAQR